MDYSFLFSILLWNMYAKYTMDSSNGHTPILPAQKSIINIIFTTNGIDGDINDGPTPVLPIDAATIVNDISRFLQNINTIRVLIINNKKYAIT